MDPDVLASLRAELGNNVNIRDNGSGGVSVNFSPADILSLMQRRPGASKVKELKSDPLKADAFLAQNKSRSSEKDTRMICCALFQAKGEELFKKKKYEEARSQYIQAIAAIVGKKFKIPLPPKNGLRSENYVKLDTWEKIHMMECCNALTRCLVQLNDIEMVRRQPYLFRELCLLSYQLKGSSMVRRSLHSVEE